MRVSTEVYPASETPLIHDVKHTIVDLGFVDIIFFNSAPIAARSWRRNVVYLLDRRTIGPDYHDLLRQTLGRHSRPLKTIELADREELEAVILEAIGG